VRGGREGEVIRSVRGSEGGVRRRSERSIKTD
jgi:hypothetical protein